MGEEGMANASREYNNFQVRANEPSARDQRLWMYNQARDENKQPLFFDTVPGDPYGDWIHRMRYFDVPDTMEAKIDLDEIFRMYPDLDIWRLIQNLDARGIDYAANDRGIGSLDEYQMAELTQGQKDMMGNPLNTPDFGVSKQDLWKKVKDMENKKWDFEWGVQKPTTPKEFNDYYNKLGTGEVGNWLAMNKGLDNWGGNLKGTFNQPGYGDPSSYDPWGDNLDWGYTPDYNYDPYDDDVLDPGFGDYAIGPLYFG